jgi:hypothetical protein
MEYKAGDVVTVCDIRTLELKEITLNERQAAFYSAMKNTPAHQAVISDLEPRPLQMIGRTVISETPNE